MLAAMVIVISGCNVEGLAFRQDKRLTIIGPGERTEVDLPVTVRWEVKDFEITGADGSARTDSGRFAVFVDRAPVGPGAPISDIARNDQQCARRQGCPDEAYFNEHRVYFTEETSFTIHTLRDTRPEERPEVRDRHEVVVILLDGRNVRIGEAAASTEFFVRRT